VLSCEVTVQQAGVALGEHVVEGSGWMDDEPVVGWVGGEEHAVAGR
jgi:hypothetical protein